MKTCARCSAPLQLGARACGSCNHPVAALSDRPFSRREGDISEHDTALIGGRERPLQRTNYPTQIGDYTVLRPLGEGGMGVVFEVYGLDGQRYALKRVRASTRGSELKRFVREGKTLAAIRHPGVVAIREFTHDEAGPFLVTELVEGDPLDERIERETLAPREAAELVAQLAEAVACVHDAGILHRDIKPSNVIVRPDGSPVLIDFGVALFEEGDRLTQTGAMLGTPAYAPPEQLAGKKYEISERSDVFGLGAILYAALTGSPPNSGDTMSALLRDAQTVESRWPTKRLVPLELESIGRRALARDPSRRYARAAELAQVLWEWLRGD